MELTLSEAASRLGVSTRQAQRLAHEGQLQIVRRVGRSIIVDDSAVAQRRHVSARRGRRWNRSTAWAAIDLVELGTTDRISGSTLTRLKKKLSEISVEEFARLAAGRSRTLRMTQTRRSAAALEKVLVLTGQSALKDTDVAAFFGLAGGASDVVEGYVVSGDLGSVITRFGLEADAEGEVFLRVVDQQVRSSRAITALDLFERGSTRERSAGARVLRDLLSSEQR